MMVRYRGGMGYIHLDGPIEPMAMRFSNGTVMENPEPEDVLDAVETVMSRPDDALWLIRGDGAVLLLRTGKELELELRYDPIGRSPQLRPAGELPLGAVTETMCEFSMRQEDWHRHLDWQPSGKGVDALPMGEEQLSASSTKTGVLRWIWPVLLALSLPAYWSAFKPGNPNRFIPFIIAIALTAMAVGAYMLGSRCPNCSRHLGHHRPVVCPHCQAKLG
jgi:hypothetical protein